ncbi:MAG TPA: hypothetical protein DCS93_10935 [Microscillaceae bacterium]|nr:hypothetical protein [Microscillaceae bacterium]
MAEDLDFDIDDKDEPRGGLNGQTLAIVGLALALVVSIIFAYRFYSSNKKFKAVDKEQKQAVDSLKGLSSSLKDSVSSKTTENEELVKRKFELEDKLNAAEDQRDSVQKLLNNSRYRERRYRLEASRLKKLLEDSEDKVDSLQKAYDEIAAGSGSTLAEYRKQIEQLTTERNSLASQNQSLQAELSKTKNDSQNALFALSVRAVPGEVRRNQFSPSTRARRTDRVQVQFKLTRAPSPEENIVVKLFDATNKEIPLKPSYRNNIGKPTPTNQQLIVEPDVDAKRKFSRGNYSIRLFLTNVNQGINNQSIGIAEFSLR